MRYFVLCALSALSLLLSHTSFANNNSTNTSNYNSYNSIELYAGQTQILPVSVARVAIGNGKLISVSIVNNKQILVLAESPGNTTLHLWMKDGSQRELTVTVLEANLKKILDDVNRLLVNVENVRAKIAGSKVVLEGEMVSDINQERAQAIVKLYPGQIVNFIGKVGWEKMIHLDVKVVELSTKGAKDLGIRWDSSINGPHAGVAADLYTNDLYRYVPDAQKSGLDFSGASLPGKIWPPKGFINLTSLITSRINLLVQDGEAEILAAPSLSTRSGSKAKFISGGEIPIPVVGGLGQAHVEFKEYGIILEVTPVTDQSGAIYAKVDVEVSNIDRSVSVSGIPGFLKRKSSAEFNSKDGETVVLNGLYSFEKSADTQKVPGAGDLPLVGGLFRDKNSSTSRREVAVIITPRLVYATPSNEPLSDLNKQKLEEIEKRMRDHEMQRPAARLSITE